MPLSPSALDELRAELKYIESMKEMLDARAQVLRAVLEPFNVGPSALAVGIGQSVGAATTKATGVNKFASTGLRAAILDVLRKRGPARAPNVAAILAEEGFKNDSRTLLNTRVYNDLWRMKEAGIVENKDGLFSLKEVA